MKEQFLQDLQGVYDRITEVNESYHEWFKLLENPEHEAGKVIEPLLEKINLPLSKENKMAMLTRVINLRDDSLDQVMKKQGFSREKMVEKKELIYNEVSKLHMQKHRQLLEWIDEQKLLTPFYRTLLHGVHSVGVAMSNWQSSWTAAIINGVNKELLELFNGDEQKVHELLHEQDLFDYCDGERADRCYSILEGKDGSYRKVAYAKAFEREVTQSVMALESTLENLELLEDEVFGQKRQWLEYLRAIKTALEHTEPDELVDYWAEVDRKWMAITTPLQIGHPLEYYEDHFRKAVALEWDLRILNPALQNDDTLQNRIKKMALEMVDNDTVRRNCAQIDRVQLYIGQPALYYGAEFNGLFSAQVVPNDERVSQEYGKKIFAFADFVLQAQRAKPTLKITYELLGQGFIDRKNDLLHNKPQLWHEIYNITTIGHEYGHVLWLDSDTESKMNASGQFKNIEEFKATCGGIVTFFANEKEELKERIIDDTVGRAVGLMAWREVDEVRPYYCEGLIHLQLLFESKVLRFDGEKLVIDYEKYEQMKMSYLQTYRMLAEHYLAKRDAGEFLKGYVDFKGGHTPVNKEVSSFVDYHWQRYLECGQQTL